MATMTVDARVPSTVGNPPGRPALESEDSGVRTAQAVFERLTRSYPSPDFAVQFWDGSVWAPDPSQPPRFTITLQHPGTLRRMLWNRTQVDLGEAYLEGCFSVEGDLEATFRLADHLTSSPLRVGDRVRTLRALMQLPAIKGHVDREPVRSAGAPHSPSRDQHAVTYHYDTSNAFFALFLDPAMVYSCACFTSDRESLETAQRRKLDYVCRKLRLRPGDRLLDVGCGWGGMLVHAGRHHGVSATGVTLSQPQADLARTRIEEAGLTGRCRVHVTDYRDLQGDGQYDKIASIGMVEHVGRANLRLFMSTAARLLKPGGAFLLHGIAESPASRARPGPFFSDRYVFPDSELPAIGEVLEAAEDAELEVRDVESLREHYVMTLRAWKARLEARREQAVAAAGRTVYEVWRLFLAGSAYRFRIGHYNLYQTLLVKPNHGASGLPLTRADWYK